MKPNEAKNRPGGQRVASLARAVFGDAWEEPLTFREALIFQMVRRQERPEDLYRAIAKRKEPTQIHTLLRWTKGDTQPFWRQSWNFLERVEAHYGLPKDYFRAKVEQVPVSARYTALRSERKTDRHLLAWHMPEDFDSRSTGEQQEIVEWFRQNILKGQTKYGDYLRRMSAHRYAIKFPEIESKFRKNSKSRKARTIEADRLLAREMAAFVKFKTEPLTPKGFLRCYPWRPASARIRIDQYGHLFGAFAAGVTSPLAGLGVRQDRLTFGLLVFPALLDWWLLWRERRRGFFIPAEKNFLYELRSITPPERGWVTQHPELAKRLVPVVGYVSRADIVRARRNWPATCRSMHKFISERISDISRLTRRHRDPFEAILPILEADSPLGEYRKIAGEILKWMPDEEAFPKEAAKAVRAYLILRLFMHTGLRQRNLRELLFCERGRMPRRDHELEELRCGELRWNERRSGWEIFIPVVAFKNSYSSFFASKPYRLLLPDLAGLYDSLEAYIERHRAALLGRFQDPGTFFVRTANNFNGPHKYDEAGFHAVYRDIIQLYGIYNPYTGRGAIPSLMPHGPHNVRDILATHVLKVTGSIEQASYAIQSTPEVVAKHYARFLPHDKSASAAKILDVVWMSSH